MVRMLADEPKLAVDEALRANGGVGLGKSVNAALGSNLKFI
ncbi:hypothetical protein Poly21_23890 [Allorhodopirellula heiligendammensis]|uniref:Uncharacterized protein n=1 Tax=Allorhodopirellula heiligendammensis TaxID=2714739 RepID=A0A5C6BVF4_9BACT|nr:hypothetical protein Poly21_23890 [Allorhodopirellula heiligendammensis]|tara:strand:- start:1086 stop:1208 length:123 start_codon:yes stop_codon:yes gene_type:complete